MTDTFDPEQVLPSDESHARRGPYRVGDRVVLSDVRGRRHVITLEVDKTFYTHRGALLHNDLIGQPEGSVITSSEGATYLAMRPSLSEHVMTMPRGAAVVYPKDAAAIVGLADLTQVRACSRPVLVRVH